MYRAVTPSSSSASTTRPDKVILQRQYREKEGECFNTLRDVLNELTGEELQTRQEILRKVIDLLLSASEIRKQREVKPIVHPALYQPCGVNTPENAATSGYIGQYAELSQWSQDWQSPAEFDAQMGYYVSQSHDQQHHVNLMFDTDMNRASSRGFGEDWSFTFNPETFH